jgi:hypothetical protein
MQRDAGFVVFPIFESTKLIVKLQGRKIHKIYRQKGRPKPPRPSSVVLLQELGLIAANIAKLPELVKRPQY